VAEGRKGNVTEALEESDKHRAAPDLNFAASIRVSFIMSPDSWSSKSFGERIRSPFHRQAMPVFPTFPARVRSSMSEPA
jgi:hypothetical protein